MSALSLLLTFLPWIAFKLISLIPLFDELIMVKIAISAAAAICIYQSLIGLNKGIIAWGSVSFFLLSFFMVVVITNIWFLGHLGVLANGTLVLLTWNSVLFGDPFTLSYARKMVDEKYWDSPQFIHKNYQISAAWGIAFTISLVDALIKLKYPGIPWYITEIIDDSSMLAAVFFTKYYSQTPSKYRAGLV